MNNNYLQGIILGTIIYFIYYQFNFKLKNKNKSINILDYIKTDSKKSISLPSFCNTNYFIFICIFTYFYNRIKVYIKKRYI